MLHWVSACMQHQINCTQVAELQFKQPNLHRSKTHAVWAACMPANIYLLQQHMVHFGYCPKSIRPQQLFHCAALTAIQSMPITRSGNGIVAPSFFCTAHTSPRGVYRHQINLCTRLTKVSINNYVIRKLGNWKLCACMQ